MDFIPFKIYLDKTILNDPEMAEDLGNYFALEILISGESNVVILSKEELSEEDEALITADVEAFLESITDEGEDDEYIN